MKALVIIVVLALLVGGGWLMFGREAADPGFAIQMRFDKPYVQGIEMRVALTRAMSERTSPSGDTNYSYVWQEWMEYIFELQDAGGKKVEISYDSHGKSKSGSPGVADIGYMKAMLKPGETYTLWYRVGGKHPAEYRASFEAPAEEKAPFSMVLDRQ